MATRIFSYDGRAFDDPDPTLTVEEVKQAMQSFFPELLTATVTEHKKEDEDTILYEFQRKTGTKGSYNALSPAMIVAAIHQVKEYHIDLIDLSWKFTKEDGTLDEGKMNMERKEIDEAADQAQSYVTAVRKVVARIFKFREQAYVVNRLY